MNNNFIFRFFSLSSSEIIDSLSNMFTFLSEYSKIQLKYLLIYPCHSWSLN